MGIRGEAVRIETERGIHHRVAYPVLDVAVPIRACSRLVDSTLDDRRCPLSRPMLNGAIDRIQRFAAR